MRSLVILAISFAVALAFDPFIKAQFDEFLSTYNKNYDSLEYATRYENFKATLERLPKLKMMSPTAEFGINEFSDMSIEEFKRTRLMKPANGQDLATACLAHGVVAPQQKLDDVPPTWDWRTKNVVSPVKNQGGCGSCWTFSVSGAIESAYAIKGNPLTQFSEQMFVDCSHACCKVTGQTVCNQGCGGGWMWSAFFDAMSWGGVEKETDYSYTGRTGQCKLDKTKIMAPVKNYTCITQPDGKAADEEQMAAYVSSTSPISIALNAEMMMSYRSGIINPRTPSYCPGGQLDHAILIVGYNKQNNPPYWIVKNSWGTSWGEQGYFRLVKGSNACGVANAAVAPVMA